MIANTYYEKALANFRCAKALFLSASGDEEQLNIIGYHLQQSIELAIKHILASNGVILKKTHDLDQLISIAHQNNVDLHLTPYLIEKADVITLWETNTRNVMGFSVEIGRIENTINELDKYFGILAKILTY